MSLFGSIFGSKKKVNMTPAEDYPSPYSLYFSKQGSGHDLRDYVERGLFHGEGLGFGPDFLSKATNPAIASREARFNETELPQLSSQLSARGLARSAGPNLATDVLTRAGQNKERDINDLLSQFYTLNEQQRKNDRNTLLGEANTLQAQEAGMLADRAAASERQVSRNVAERDSRFNAEQGAASNILNAAGGFLSGGGLGRIGEVVSGIPGIGKSLGGFFQNANTIGQSVTPKSNILGGDDFDSLLIQELLRRRQA